MKRIAKDVLAPHLYSQPMVHRVLDPSSTREILSASLSDLKSCLESFSPSAAQACASYVALGLVFLIDNATAKT